MDEAQLVRFCKEANASAQKILYNKYVGPMMVLCLRYVVSGEDAKEVLMDAFFSFFKNIKTFTYQGEGSVSAWLKKIVVNQCLMHLRKRKAFFLEINETTEYKSTEGGDDIFAHLNVKEILDLIHSLPDGYRTVFNLYSFEGKNHREISDILGISENTSKSQLHRARAILKEKIVKAF